MSSDKKWNLLFIKDQRSSFDSNTKKFDELFNKVDIASANEEAMKLLYLNAYDIIIGDLSVATENVALLKQIKDMKKEPAIFALVSPKDEDKLYKISELGIHAFELTPEQFDLALEQIAQFNPYQGKK